MNRYRQALRRYLRETEPTDQARSALRRRLHAALDEREQVRSLLRELPIPDTRTEQELRTRLAASARHTAKAAARPRPRRLLIPLTAALAALIALLLFTRPASDPAPSGAMDPIVGNDPAHSAPDAAPNSPPAPLELVADAETLLSVGHDVELRYRGEGRVGGTVGAPRIDWIDGRLGVEVTPNRGIELSVHTEEALVEVVGTGFIVDRDAAGTTVEVTHGRVRVSCRDREPVLLGAGETALCRTLRPAALLLHARRLLQDGAPPEEVLTEVDAALRSVDSGPIYAELLYLRIEALIALDRREEAAEACRRYLDAGAAARRAEVDMLLTSLTSTK